MSLFKTRDWWSVTVGEEEEFDHGCLCIANVDNDTSGYDKIIIGSFQGVLRIFNPNPNQTSSAEDVVVEQAFQQPILQVGVGRFSSASDSLTLALLHPRKLAVFNVSAIAGTVEHGSQHQLKLLYEHNLQRSAFNFCYGPFGGVKGKDFICVQSMDGTVSIFEQESFAFSRFLPGALLPGPIRYMPRVDSFVTGSSSWQIEVYKYQVLAVASETAGREESQIIKTGKKVVADWCYNLGEQAVDIAYVEFPTVPPCILILGERNVFCLTDNGNLKFMKKLEYDVSCILPYISLTENSVNYLVGSHTNSLLVYQDVTLKWMAKTDFVPVHLCVGNFRGLRSGVVGLSDTGRLHTMYLGTDPSIFTPPQVESREVNFANIDAEMARLMQHVKNKSTGAVIKTSVKKEDDLSLAVHCSPSIDQGSLASGIEFQEDFVPSVTVRIQMKTRLILEAVKLDIHCPWPLACNQTEFNISSIEPNTPSETFVAVFQRFTGMPSHMYVHISATYSSAAGGRRVVTTRANLPTSLVVKPVLPVKTSVHKLTIETNKPAANLNDIFPDLLGENAGGQGAALGFQFLGSGPVVTVLASKTSQRYRLQCDRLEAMWLPLKELTSRLYAHFQKGGNSDFRISFDGSLPLQEYFELLDHHFELRTASDKCRELLSQTSAQFRTIQKRLLTRFKDKTPAPLQNLDTLLEGTYRRILSLADVVDNNNKEEQQACSRLSSGTYLLDLLLRLWVDLSDEEVKVLETAISPVVNTSEMQGWEESTDAAVTHLLRTVMSKTAKDQMVNPSPLTLAEDTSKVKKHIALFCDRLGKGARLVDGLSEKKERQLKISAPKTIFEKDETSGSINQDEPPAVEKVLNTKFRTNKKKKRRGEGQGDELPVLGLPQFDSPSAGMTDNSFLRNPGKLDSLEQQTRQSRDLDSLVPDLDEMNLGSDPRDIIGDTRAGGDTIFDANDEESNNNNDDDNRILSNQNESVFSL